MNTDQIVCEEIVSRKFKNYCAGVSMLFLSWAAMAWAITQIAQ